MTADNGIFFKYVINYVTSKIVYILYFIVFSNSTMYIQKWSVIKKICSLNLYGCLFKYVNLEGCWILLILFELVNILTCFDVSVPDHIMIVINSDGKKDQWYRSTKDEKTNNFWCLSSSVCCQSTMVGIVAHTVQEEIIISNIIIITAIHLSSSLCFWHMGLEACNSRGSSSETMQAKKEIYISCI